MSYLINIGGLHSLKEIYFSIKTQKRTNLFFKQYWIYLLIYLIIYYIYTLRPRKVPWILFQYNNIGGVF